MNRRVVWKVILANDTPLHVGGSGWVEARRASEMAGKPVLAAGLIRDGNGLPYVPAASLRGNLRARMSKEVPELCPVLFGSQEAAGPLWVGPALLATSKAPQPQVDVSVAIHRATGAADDQKLFHSEWIPSGQTFAWEIQADGLDAAAEQRIELELARMASVHPMRLGRKTGNGRGVLRLISVVKRVLEPVAVATWAKADGTCPLPWTEAPLTLSVPASIPESNVLEFRICLHFDGPFLVNDPSLTHKAGPNRTGGISQTPLLLGGRAFLPASSLRGRLRAQTERIWNTIQAGIPLPNDPASWLFGDTGHKGLLEFGDFTDSGPGKVDQATMIAIDRFTGAVANGKTFTAKYVERPRLEGRVRLDMDRALKGGLQGSNDPRWLLLLFVLRDLVEGDLRFGFGVNRGFGGCRAVLEAVLPRNFPSELESSLRHLCPSRNRS